MLFDPKRCSLRGWHSCGLLGQADRVLMPISGCGLHVAVLTCMSPATRAAHGRGLVAENGVPAGAPPQAVVITVSPHAILETCTQWQLMDTLVVLYMTTRF